MICSGKTFAKAQPRDAEILSCCSVGICPGTQYVDGDFKMHDFAVLNVKSGQGTHGATGVGGGGTASRQSRNGELKDARSTSRGNGRLRQVMKAP